MALNEIEKLLLEALRDLRDDGPPLPNDGICFNVEELVPDNRRVQDELQLLLSLWPEAHENQVYPVEGSASLYMRAQVDKTMWDNPRRHELLHWMIKELENE